MSWLDHVLAVPVIGVAIEPNLERLSSTQRRLATLLDDLLREEGQVTFEGANPWAMNIRTPNGFLHKIHPDSLVVQFQYPLVQEQEEGELPRFISGERGQFSDLLVKTRDRMDQLLDAVVPESGLKLLRIGIVASASLKRDSLPPGVQQFLGQLEKPWLGPLIKSETTLLAVIEDRESWTDRCHHGLQFDETASVKAFRFKLDWQRVMKSAVLSNRAAITSTLDACQRDAMT